MAASMPTLKKCVYLSALSIFALTPATFAGEEVDFTRDVRPILVKRCFTCHGPDEKKREGELRLDLRAAAIEDAIVPGKSAKSSLIDRIQSSDPEEVMPPAKSKRPKLTASEIDLLKRWIDSGAKYEEHWAWTPANKSAVPAGSEWTKNSIDQFIAAKHTNEKLAPSPEANRLALIRRLSFDLIGLPPTPTEIEAFVADKSPQAYEKLVDRLLGSKHFGERMAVYWLDVVRYADTNGYHSDNPREHTPYRDYVIDAFNNNMPYDQFIREQLAGDLLKEPTNNQKIASGFNRLSMSTQEGGAQPKEYVAIYAADRVRNTNSIFLGLTMGCCQCHDHKYDPITMRDFYSFAAFFADIKETIVGGQKPVTLLDPTQSQREYELNVVIAEAQKGLDTATPALAAAQAKWEATLPSTKQIGWTAFKPQEVKSQGGAEFQIASDGSILAKGKSPDKDTYTITLPSDLKNITGLRLEALSHDSLKAKGPGRATNGNFVIGDIKLTSAGKHLPFRKATASFSQNGYDIKGVIDNNPVTGWAVMPQFGKTHEAVLSLATPSGDKPLTLSIKQEYGSSHSLGHFRLAWTTSADPHAGTQSGFPGNVGKILAIASDQRNDGQKNELAKYYRSIAPELAPLRDKIAAAKKEKENIGKAARKILISMAMTPRVVRILNRGDWQDESGEIVQPAVPARFGKLELKEGERGTRLDLANWIATSENPLTSRVMVNRLWQLMFGRGLVDTPGDFGAQGNLPSHAGLLDYLAIDFTENDWDVKRTIKQMVMSATYRQSSATSASLLDRDPSNQLLARQGRFRLDAEFIRDNALAISGLLSDKVGGSSVKPYQPAGYWAHLNFPRRTWKHDSGENQYRRGIYTYWQRTFLHPSLATFDAPSREECTVQRPISNTPLQALVLLNDPTYVEAGRKFAERIVLEGGKTDRERLSFAYRHALGRDIADNEAKILADLVNKHRKDFEINSVEAPKINTVGLAPANDKIPPIELAAWTSVARTILNLHETITRN